MSPQEGAFVIMMQTNQICKFNFLDAYSLVVVFEHWRGLTGFHYRPPMYNFYIEYSQYMGDLKWKPC